MTPEERNTVIEEVRQEICRQRLMTVGVNNILLAMKLALSEGDKKLLIMVSEDYEWQKTRMENAIYVVVSDIRSGIQTPCGSDDGPRGTTYSNEAYEQAAKKLTKAIPALLKAAGF